MKESPQDPKARLALGQALHLKGRGAEADEILRQIAFEKPDDPETLLWLGRAQMARNRHLAAYMSVEHAIKSGGKEPEYWLAQGDAARKRGDYGRSMNRYQTAEQAGGNPATVEAARKELAAETEFDRDAGGEFFLRLARTAHATGWGGVELSSGTRAAAESANHTR